MNTTATAGKAWERVALTFTPSYAAAMTRSYAKIVAEHRRRYPHQVRLRNAGDWRFDHCSRAHYQVTRGNLVWWHEATGEAIFGFKTAEQAAAFQHWADTCGIDWTVEPRAQPLPHPEPPPERPWAYGRAPEGRGTPERYRP